MVKPLQLMLSQETDVGNKNNWTEYETLMQFTGYLHGRALQEWNLMNQIEHATVCTTQLFLG